MRVLFVTHPEVEMDPARPVTDWSLSAVGRKRMRHFCERLVGRGLGCIWCSEERKSIEAGQPMAERLGVGLRMWAALGENDRSSTGFLAPEQFEVAAGRFFAEPERSFQGWERAVDAQARIVRAVDEVIAASEGVHAIAIVSHGAVGTLLWCHLQGCAISREHDQPRQGHWYWIQDSPRRAQHGWRPLESDLGA